MGIRCMMFFDDGSVGGEAEMGGKKIAATLKDTLQRAGWVANEEKSCWQPSQKPKILGFVLDLLEGKVFCHRKKGKWFGKVVENVAIKRQAKCKRTGQIGWYVSVDVIRNRSGNEAQDERDI